MALCAIDSGDLADIVENLVEVALAESETNEDEAFRHQTGFDEGCENVAVGVEPEVIAASEHDSRSIGHLAVYLQQPAIGHWSFMRIALLSHKK